MNGNEVVPDQKPSVSQSAYTGNSIVDYLHSIGEKASFNRRKELAKEYGVANYRGTAEQNLLLLRLMRDVPKQKPAKVIELLDIDGSWGIATTKRTQEYFKVYADGIVSRQPKSNREYLYAASTSSWKFVSNYEGGSRMAKALQSFLTNKGYYAGVLDGYFGKKSVIAFQNFLRDQAYYDGNLDGSMGKQTTKAWQRYLNDHLK